MKDLPRLPPGEVVLPRGDPGRRVGFLLPPPGRLAPRPPSRPVGDAVQPAARRLRLADRAGLAGQDEERGLEGVLGVGPRTEDTPADVEDHRAVAGDEGAE